MADDIFAGPFGFAGEVMLVAVGAMGVAGMFQDYALFNRPEVVTLQNIALKYVFAMAGSIAVTIGNRKLRQARRQHSGS